MSEPSELREASVAYGRPAGTAGAPPEAARPEPWSHPWHDQLGLLYHRAMAEKIRLHPELRRMAVENVDRWILRNDYPASVLHALGRWRELLTTASLEHLLAAMIDPSEHGHQARQNTPFAGILTQEERLRIRDEHEKAATH